MPDAALASGTLSAQRSTDESSVRSGYGEFPVAISGLHGQQAEHCFVDRRTSRADNRAHPMNMERSDKSDVFGESAENANRPPHHWRRCGGIQNQRPLPEAVVLTDERGDLASLTCAPRYDVRLGATPSVSCELLDQATRMPEQICEGLRSRSPSYLSTHDRSLHLAVEQGEKPMSTVIMAGQCGDSPQFEPVLAMVRVSASGRARPRARPDPVRADKAYASRRNRVYLPRCGTRCTLPDKADQTRNHHASSAGRYSRRH